MSRWSTAEIRAEFFKFFESKSHTRVASSSLIPSADPTLLFVNAGMVQFKDCFLGAENRDYQRATSCQKCLRISGKHNDLENVGRTARHHTFFEMLGNFSFGDYFKKEAIEFAWEFLVTCLELDPKRLWVTIFDDDDEAQELWKRHSGVLDGRILRCGEKDNFWAMGDTGPCGPCSELHYYIGDDVQSEAEFRKDDGSYLEVWNLVFMQYSRDASGELTPLPKPSVDTGMGLERISAIKQGVISNYDSDILRALIRKTEDISSLTYWGRNYSEKKESADRQYDIDVAMRVIADHARAAAFLIADGVIPGSDGRGYVIRRLIRRAARHSKALGLEGSFLFEIADELISIMAPQYEELEKSREKIVKLIHEEEERFSSTLSTGLQFLNREIDKLKSSSSKILSGTSAFVLHDTYGFPLDLTSDILRREAMAVDESEFNDEMQKQKERSRSSRASEATLVLRKAVKPQKTNFVGYSTTEYESELSGLFSNSGSIEFAKEGEQIAVVTTETPFYAQSGGQIGDTGSITSSSCSLEVFDTQKAEGDTIVHICRVKDGEIRKGESVRLEVDANRRYDLCVHHSSTHLLHQALQEVVGENATQAGSRVGESSLRFDFYQDKALSQNQLSEIERRVNSLIRENREVLIRSMSLDEAKAEGARALFGEKYGAIVRVVNIGTESMELCGGHACGASWRYRLRKGYF